MKDETNPTFKKSLSNILKALLFAFIVGLLSVLIILPILNIIFGYSFYDYNVVISFIIGGIIALFYCTFIILDKLESIVKESNN